MRMQSNKTTNESKIENSCLWLQQNHVSNRKNPDSIKQGRSIQNNLPKPTREKKVKKINHKSVHPLDD